MREIVSVHIGQCGNQIGAAFWNRMLLEHEKSKDDDPSMLSFFYKDRKNLRARALLVDMECGVLNETMRSSLGPLFEETQFIMDVSGSGNNFAQGHYSYGPQYSNKILDSINHLLERCDSIQGFFLTHSLGGGTGSGFGTYLLELLHEYYPTITRYSTCVYPSDEPDVITSPYNTIQATNSLIESGDCVFPINNSSLFLFNTLEMNEKEKELKKNNDCLNENIIEKERKKEKGKGFERVNQIVARMLCHLSSASRFNGSMNIDMSEIYMNLVPFPRLHFLLTSLNVFQKEKKRPGVQSDSSRAALQRAFSDITSLRGQLSGMSLTSQYLQHQISSSTSSTASSRQVITLASAFIGRGKIRLSDFLSCVNHAQQTVLKYPTWNTEACKIGLCDMPAPEQDMSVMGIYNSSSFSSLLEREMKSFRKLFRVKAMLHHYTDYIDEETIRLAELNVQDLIEDYESLETGSFPRQNNTITQEMNQIREHLGMPPSSLFDFRDHINYYEDMDLFPSF